jgi:hypothetical protein
VAVILALVLVIDLAAAGAVLFDRRDHPDTPSFQRVDLTHIDRDIDTYRGRAAEFGFRPEPDPPARVHPDGEISYGEGVNPAVNAMFAIACLDRTDGDRRRWQKLAEHAVLQVLRSTPGGLLPLTAKSTDPFGDPLPVPTYSAVAQGLMLSALARLYETTGQERWRRAASATFTELRRFRGFFRGSEPAPTPWLSLVDSDGHLWFETYTIRRTPVRDVAAQVLSTLGLYDFRRVLADSPLLRRQSDVLLSGGLATLEAALPSVRRPFHSARVSLAAGTSDVRSQQQIEQGLLLLAKILKRPGYVRLSRLLDRDDDLPSAKQADLGLAGGASPFEPLPRQFGYTCTVTAPQQLDDGLVATADGVLQPSSTAKLALGCLERYRVTGRDVWLTRAEQAVSGLLARAEDGLVPHRYTETDALGAPLPDPWYSAETQGLLLAGATELAKITRQERWVLAADRLFDSLRRFRDFGPDLAPPARPWVSTLDDSGYLWFEAYPTDQPPSLLLHVQLSTLLAVYDYWDESRNPLAREMAISAATTVRHYLPRMRRPGRVPWDCLAARTPNPATEALVTAQLAELAEITCDPTTDSCSS